MDDSTLYTTGVAEPSDCFCAEKAGHAQEQNEKPQAIISYQVTKNDFAAFQTASVLFMGRRSLVLNRIAACGEMLLGAVLIVMANWQTSWLIGLAGIFGVVIGVISMLFYTLNYEKRILKRAALGYSYSGYEDVALTVEVRQNSFNEQAINLKTQEQSLTTYDWRDIQGVFVAKDQLLIQIAADKGILIPFSATVNPPQEVMQVIRTAIKAHGKNLINYNKSPAKTKKKTEAHKIKSS